MRFFTFLAAFTAILVLLTPLNAQAGPKPWPWSWWPSHWQNLNFERPYLNEAHIPHNSQWDNDEWTPYDWAGHHSDPKAMINNLYAAKIITDQYTDDNVPVLEVGHNFIRLSGEDKRRVAAYVDHVFGITRSESGMFHLYYDATGKPIGIYTKAGLQLQ